MFPDHLSSISKDRARPGCPDPQLMSNLFVRHSLDHEQVEYNSIGWRQFADSLDDIMSRRLAGGIPYFFLPMFAFFRWHLSFVEKLQLTVIIDAMSNHNAAQPGPYPFLNIRELVPVKLINMFEKLHKGFIEYLIYLLQVIHIPVTDGIRLPPKRQVKFLLAVPVIMQATLEQVVYVLIFLYQEKDPLKDIVCLT
jgi:hypothetical protein